MSTMIVNAIISPTKFELARVKECRKRQKGAQATSPNGYSIAGVGYAWLSVALGILLAQSQASLPLAEGLLYGKFLSGVAS